ncbi:MAG: DUF418 domain-containing protein [Firmicutes bacterium]|nr:DUF418 domain-containing protein [Bacillota bacterium]
MAAARPTANDRIAGVDLARALAFVGMLMVHIGPTSGRGLAGALYALPHGRASVLFVLVAGMGVSLLARSGLPPWAVRRRLIWRSLVLLPLGLALQELDHPVLVILQEYAVLFLLGAVTFRLPARWLLFLSLLAGLFGPVAFLAGRLADPVRFSRAAVSLSDSPGDIVHGLILSGPYPLVTWACPFLLGMWLARHDLRSRSVRAAMVGLGALAAVGTAGLSRWLVATVFGPGRVWGWAQLATDGPHSQMPLWLFGSAGAAAMVLGLALVVADALGRRAWPMVAVGRMALTLYAGHLLLLHWAGPELRTPFVVEAFIEVIAIVLVSVLFSVAWLARYPRGPLEAVIRLPQFASEGTGGAKGADTP